MGCKNIVIIFGVFSTLMQCESFLPEFDFGSRFDFSNLQGPVPTDPDVYRNVSQLIESKGYPVEEHFVVTQDYYILNIQRIPYGRRERGARKSGKPVVLLQHGLLADSASWVLNFPNNSLAYMLADHGFDVWLANSRGNRYSSRNTKLSPCDPEFWKWSFDSMVKYDVPATIHYILNKSSQEKLFYIGHSQGTLIAFASFSKYLEVAEKVKLFIALAPIATIGNIDVSFLKTLADIVTAIGPFARIIDSPFFPGKLWREQFIQKGFCNGITEQKLCYYAVEFLVGEDNPNVNYSRVPVLFHNFPSGTSFRNMVHFAQLVVSGKCQMFDYGPIENYIIYKQEKPPVYPIENMTVPTALVSGSHDTLSDPRDVKLLAPRIKFLISDTTIENWNHLDFIFGKDANVKLYPQIIKLIESHFSGGIDGQLGT